MSHGWASWQQFAATASVRRRNAAKVAQRHCRRLPSMNSGFSSSWQFWALIATGAVLLVVR
jgi:hypothetical protein